MGLGSAVFEDEDLLLLEDVLLLLLEDFTTSPDTGLLLGSELENMDAKSPGFAFFSVFLGGGILACC